MTPSDRHTARMTQTFKELGQDLAAMVESGDITPMESIEWLVEKQRQWFGADS